MQNDQTAFGDHVIKKRKYQPEKSFAHYEWNASANKKHYVCSSCFCNRHKFNTKQLSAMFGYSGFPHSLHLPSGPIVPIQDSSLHSIRFSQSSSLSKMISAMLSPGFIFSFIYNSFHIFSIRQFRLQYFLDAGLHRNHKRKGF